MEVDLDTIERNTELTWVDRPTRVQLNNFLFPLLAKQSKYAEKLCKKDPDFVKEYFTPSKLFDLEMQGVKITLKDYGKEKSSEKSVMKAMYTRRDVVVCFVVEYVDEITEYDGKNGEDKELEWKKMGDITEILINGKKGMIFFRIVKEHIKDRKTELQNMLENEVRGKSSTRKHTGPSMYG